VNQPESARGSEVQGHFGFMGSQHGTCCLAPIQGLEFVTRRVVDTVDP